MSKCKKKFWFDNVSELFSDNNVIIRYNMSIEDKMNSLSRIVICIFFLLLILKFENSFLFLIFSLLIIIIIYYINKKQMEQESYEAFSIQSNIRNNETTFEQKDYNRPYSNPYKVNYPNPYKVNQNYESFNNPAQPTDVRSQLSSYNNPKSNYTLVSQNQNIQPKQFSRPMYLFENRTKNNVVLNTPSSYVLGSKDINMDDEYNKPGYISKNQLLTGAVNPRTLIAPVIVPPIADLDYWKTNNLVTHSSINDQKQTDIYLSGYQVTTDCYDSDNLF